MASRTMCVPLLLPEAGGAVAYRDLFVVEIVEMLRRWKSGAGYRKVGESVGADRKTVRRYVEVAQALGLERGDGGVALDDEFVGAVVSVIQPGAPPLTGAMRQHCREHREAIEGWVAEGCKGPKVVRLLTRKTGVVVPLRTLQRFLAEELDEGVRRGGSTRRNGAACAATGG